MSMIDGDEYTKISIQKDLHNFVKYICKKEGTKMYFFEDKAIKDYIKTNYSKYINASNNNILED